MLIYVSGPYTENATGTVDEHIENARGIAIRLWTLGHAVICPHLNTAHFEELCDLAWNTYLEGDLNMISRCDALVMTEDWEQSRGARIEHSYAKEIGIPIYYYHKEPLPYPHITEQRCPNQSRAFREVLGKMYRTHLDKNADYSPANILGAGELGLVTRLWDKVARLMNLTGFKIDLHTKVSFEAPRDPKNESIEDTYQDLAVYGIIGLLLRWGKWGN